MQRQEKVQGVGGGVHLLCVPVLGSPGNPGYDAAAFVTTYLRFCYTYASPKVVQVDPGSILVDATERPD